MGRTRTFGIVRFALACVTAVAVSTGCGEAAESSEIDEADELEPGGAVGKEDNAGVPGLPVDGDFSATEVWEVENRWEDTDTAAAREAGLAWGADSGLTWDEKYAEWLQSMKKIDGVTVAKTFEVTTPWGKTLPAPKLDCADTSILLRASFAAWYKLPFYLVAFDGGKPVYFGHFGIRTQSGIWNNMPKFAQFGDFSDMSEGEFNANWPQDKTLRKRGVQKGDDQPFMEPGARTGTYLDEIHLNKRAGRFIRLVLIFTGSTHLADSRNTFNLEPESMRAGDTLLWRWQATGVGHTMVTMRVDDIGGGKLEAQSVFGNLPPNQPIWDGAAETKRNFVDERGGGQDETEDFSKFNGGLKRWRVAKDVGGFWTNTFMVEDEASWINDKDLDKMRARPKQFNVLLGEVSPEQMRDVLSGVIESKREHIRQFPASCSARIKREDAFEDLYQLMEEEFGQSKADVDAQFRTFEDYVFAELEYKKSKTCCWNSTTSAMFDTIMDLNNKLQEEAGDACVQPLVFKARDGDYAAFRDHNSAGWVPWSEDEDCPQRDAVEGVEAEVRGLPYCEWKAAEGSGGGGGGGDAASCEGQCGGSSSDGSCFCDDACRSSGDCCSDFDQACG